MTNLDKLQRQFVNSVLTDDDSHIAGSINAPESYKAELIDIYRNNTIGGITNAMELTYPVIVRLVGEDFFKATAKEYLNKYYPISGNLDDYGGEFPVFLESFPPVKPLPYIADIARLEWAFHESSLANKENPLDGAALSKIPQDKYFNLAFKLHNSAKFIESEYPIHLIWKMNDTESDDNDSEIIDLEKEGGARLLIIRPYLKVSIIPLLKCEYVFLQSLNEKNSLYQAFEDATELDEEFDLAFYMNKYLASGVFSNLL